MLRIYAIALIWICGGFIYVGNMARWARERPEVLDAELRDCFAGIGRGDPAAMVAVLLFVTIWPAIFLATTLKARCHL
ncbi:hypothetical protein [Aquamicrobium soli]|uniref:Uncharacterized protein n=1 Tax=Aquamicrobium soli TaxID=1811518 RepID=A0ABV7KK50_9HYPH